VRSALFRVSAQHCWGQNPERILPKKFDDLIRLNNLTAKLRHIVWAGQHDIPSLWQPLILEMSIGFAN
jgi:hypothetical protein